MSTLRPVAGWSLRAKLLTLILTMIAFVCLGISAITHVSVSHQIESQATQELERAVDRADRFTKTPGADHDVDEAPGQSSGSPSFLDAPGQGEYSLGVVMTDGAISQGGYIDESGTTQELGDQDRAVLAALSPSDGLRDVSLSIGEYRLAVQDGADGSTVIIGVRTEEEHRTLMRLDATLAAVSLAVLAVAAGLGWFLIRRTLEPLREVALVADDVAATPLAEGAVEPIARVRPTVARQGDEVGAVARALNTMLDNVDIALQTRHNSELQVRRFVADASHELRTPLTSIRGYADLLCMHDTGDEQMQLSVARILSQTSRMSALVDDMLLLARLDHGAAEAAGQSTRFDVGELVAEAVLDAQVVSSTHDFDLDLPEEPLPVEGDPQLVERLLTNIVGNARKHTPEGTRVSVKATAREGFVSIVVADTGDGMPADLVETIFDRFSRGDSSRTSGTSREGSSGLGMPIAKAVVERLGGTIDVHSRIGEGTEVRIRLPLASAETA